MGDEATPEGLAGGCGWVQQAFRDEPNLYPSLPGIRQNYADLSAPLRLMLGAMKKNLAAEVATLSGGEPSGFANRGSWRRIWVTLAKPIRSRYLLSFRPTSKAPGMHTLAVRVVWGIGAGGGGTE